MQLKLPTASLVHPGPPKPEHSNHGMHVQHCMQSAAAPRSDAQTHMGLGATPRSESRLRRDTAAQAHAGHAGLLRFKRQWPMPRPLMLSDSDDSDSLNEFDSIADFHIESPAGQKLPHQDSCRPDAEPGSQAICLGSSGARRSVANSSKAIEAGQSVKTE